jgi:hypothetical protein
MIGSQPNKESQMTRDEIIKQTKTLIGKAASLESDAAEICFQLILMDRGESREQGMADDWDWYPPVDPDLRAVYDVLDRIGAGEICRLAGAAADLMKIK